MMSKKSFIQTERDIGEFWEKEMQQSTLEAGREEKEIAIKEGTFHHGVPAITVIVRQNALTSIPTMQNPE